MRSIDQNMSNFAAQFPFRYESWVFLGEQNIDFCVHIEVCVREVKGFCQDYEGGTENIL
mgnify:CR=1 FL=1